MRSDRQLGLPVLSRKDKPSAKSEGVTDGLQCGVLRTTRQGTASRYINGVQALCPLPSLISWLGYQISVASARLDFVQSLVGIKMAGQTFLTPLKMLGHAHPGGRHRNAVGAVRGGVRRQHVAKGPGS